MEKHKEKPCSYFYISLFEPNPTQPMAISERAPALLISNFDNCIIFTLWNIYFRTCNIAKRYDTVNYLNSTMNLYSKQALNVSKRRYRRCQH